MEICQAQEFTDLVAKVSKSLDELPAAKTEENPSLSQLIQDILPNISKALHRGVRWADIISCINQCASKPVNESTIRTCYFAKLRDFFVAHRKEICAFHTGDTKATQKQIQENFGIFASESRVINFLQENERK